MTIRDDLDFAQRLADAAGEAIRPFYRARFDIESKSDLSPVTQADRAAEAAMRAIIEKERPQDGIVGEEYGTVREDAGRVWVLDPIDGTRSFIAGRPIFGTLVAMMQEGWPILGIIDQPISRERWCGMAGQPTTLNGQPVRTRPCRALDQAILASTGPQYFPGCSGEHFSILAGQCRDTVWGGDCYNYALLASGQIDLVVESGLKLYDIAALVPVVEGAGGHMCDWTGNPLDRDSKGDVIAMGDIARMDDILEALAHGHEGH
ncbi:histidinol-phosphatase [Rhizorhapis suberifaciens]|uniref:Histidinol-phosphatase n=1 Tax=Rhizorhapis suberifaciens TaxID=13656 RepID=A0A840HRV3_9SPHN|nr:histidinol-phosphatase [Rhizorhapis suberifaciens]MBB4640685.1 histidinol phosphatase-like enzyme (inositol monophosphatase family) [Rhizorhapis suberifaciens]